MPDKKSVIDDYDGIRENLDRIKREREEAVKDTPSIVDTPITDEYNDCYCGYEDILNREIDYIEAIKSYYGS